MSEKEKNFSIKRNDKCIEVMKILSKNEIFIKAILPFSFDKSTKRLNYFNKNICKIQYLFQQNDFHKPYSI